MKRLREWWRKMSDDVQECLDYDLFVTFQRIEQQGREDKRKLREYKRIKKRLPGLIAELERTTEKLRSLAK